MALGITSEGFCMENINSKDKVENIEPAVSESADLLAHILVTLLDSIKKEEIKNNNK